MDEPIGNPRIDGLEPTFRHLDDPDVPWQQCRRQRNADGTESSVWEKWLAFSPDPPYLSLYARYDPGMIVRRHGHYSPHVVFVIDGELWVGERRCPAGTHIELPFGAAFGPLRSGEAGATLFEVMLGDPRSWGDEPERFEQALADAGAEALPDVPLDYPAWLQDLRHHWVGAADSVDAADRTEPVDGAASRDAADDPGAAPLAEAPTTPITPISPAGTPATDHRDGAIP